MTILKLIYTNLKIIILQIINVYLKSAYYVDVCKHNFIELTNKPAKIIRNVMN